MLCDIDIHKYFNKNRFYEAKLKNYETPNIYLDLHRVVTDLESFCLYCWFCDSSEEKMALYKAIKSTEIKISDWS